MNNDNDSKIVLL